MAGWTRAKVSEMEAIDRLRETAQPLGTRRDDPNASWVLGIGSALPARSISQGKSLEFAKQMLFPSDLHGRAVDALYRKSAVDRRGSVLLEGGGADEVAEGVSQSFFPPAESAAERGPTTRQRIQRFHEEALPLARRACVSALRDASVTPDQVTHLVVVTCTGFQSPGVDVGLIRELGLSPETERVQVGFMGCHGAINGLRVAHGLSGRDPAARVLVVCVELCSLHYQYGWETDHVVSNAIFADGAAALVIGGDRATADAREARRRGDTECADDAAGSDAAGHGGSGLTQRAAELFATGSYWIADSEQAMTWKIGDHGFEMTLSAEVPERIRAELPGYLESWLARHGLRWGDIGGWAVHPGGPRILSAVQSSLGLTDDQLADSRQVLADHGNMSSPTMLFILERFARSDRQGPWLMLGFGPGLEVEVALIR
jgi:predicted naringenin-chalcone synthase